MAASSDTSLEESLISFNKKRYLRCAEIYGANGSGKTSLIDAMARMASIVLGSNSNQPGDFIVRLPHKQSKNAEPTSFEMIFEKAGIKYSYGFAYGNEGVLEEYLYYWPSGKKSMVFERDSAMDYSFAEPFKKAGENCNGRLRANKLLLSCAANETDITPVLNAFLFYKNDLVFYGSGLQNWYEYSVGQLKNNPETKKKFIGFMNSIGSDLKDVKIKIENRPLNSVDGMAFLAAGQVPKIVSVIDLKLVYPDVVIDIGEESSGVQALFRFVCPMIDILENNKVLVADEIEAHLHPSIVADIVRRFTKNGAPEGQLIMTTHNTDLLDLDEIRRDQVWFTELKKKTRSTDLYSLAEIKNVRKGENIKKGYITGRYGAIPMLNSNIREGVK
ncbi:MAG: ATP-binding protein [Fibrobacter sp.]|nr:ATP-binding protein [Fibrobacter sp.]